MVHAVARYGYAGASVAKVVERAGVSRATFYEHFRDREECFLVAYRGIVAGVRAAIGSASAAADPAARPRAVLEALLDHAAADPDVARFLLIESLAAGAAPRAEHERSIVEL